MPALRWLHVSAGLGLVALFGFAPGEQAALNPGQFGFWSSLVLLGAVLIGVTLLGDPAESASIEYQSKGLITLKRKLRKLVPALSRILVGLAGLLAIGAIVYAAVNRVPRAAVPLANYPEIDHAGYAIMVLALIGMSGLIAANIGLAVGERKSPARRLNRRFAPFAGGMACSLVTSAGLFLAVGYVGAFGLAAATFFDTDEHPVAAPELLQRVVYAWGITAAVFVLLGLVALVHRTIRANGFRERVTADFTKRDDSPATKSLRLPERWVRRVASAMWAARLKNHLVVLSSLFALVGLLLSAVAALELQPQWSGEPRDLGGAVGWLSESEAQGSDRPVVGFLMWLGGLTLTGLAALLVFLGRTALLGESARRGVNVLWDVIAYWPRSAHPLVPPPYSQRSVADIRGRIAWHLGTLSEGTPEANPAPTDRLVLCGHSQGSLLSFTALVTMGRSPELEKVGLLTFGSQLQVLFSRAFPAYVNYPTISWLYAALGGRWRNLYRETDHLAGPVLSWNHRSGPIGRVGARPPPEVLDGRAGRREYGADWRLLDPPLPDRILQERPLTALRRHSDYWMDDAWKDAVIAVLAPGGGDPDVNAVRAQVR